MQHPHRFFAAALVAASLSLTACSGEPETITANGSLDPMAADLAKAQPVELPPAISASRTYRCKDNSLMYADFYTNNTVNVHLGERSAPGTTLTAPDANSAYTAEGYSVSGNTATINFTAPGKGSQSCKA